MMQDSDKKAEVISKLCEINKKINELNSDKEKIVSESFELLTGYKLGDTLSYKKHNSSYRSIRESVRHGKICDFKIFKIEDNLIVIRIYVYRMLKSGEIGKSRDLATEIIVSV